MSYTRQPVGPFPGRLVRAIHSERALIDPKITSDLCDRLARLAPNPDRALTELRIEPAP
jgi:hypothetical protein